MNVEPRASAIAELDAICDEYERAYRFDELSSVGDSAASLGPWLDRVEPELRTWLQEELLALRQEFQASSISREEAQRRLEVPVGVDVDAWRAIAQCPTFHALSEDAILALAKSIQPREFRTGSVLLTSGEPSSGLYLIVEGRVTVISGEGANRHQLDTDGAGGVLGEMSLLTGHPCSADVVATKNVRSLELPVEGFNALRDEHPEIEIALSQLVSDRLGHRTLDALCGKSLGGFRLLRCISSGAMGVVYAAEDESDGTPRALKMLRHRFIYNPRVVSRFDQEAEFLRQLTHPNIVSLRGHFVAYRTRFIVLDLYDGADLREVIRQFGPMPEATARAVLGQIAAGLQDAHQRGVLHLDLKPANVLVGNNGHVAITDFGLGRLIEADGCDEEVVGTPLYMPPEQFTMTNVGPHCDWYSFACIAFELLTGERLFKADYSSQLMDRKLRAPSTTWPQLEASEEVQLLLRSALQPQANKRELALEKIATWARPVPELAAALGEISF
jgi:CRP-like cAMP-binding protein